MKLCSKLLALTLLGVVLCWPASSRAQTNEAPAKATEPKPEKKKAAAPKQQTLPFKGTLGAVDKGAKTIKVGERTFQITSVTRIFKDGKPALLEAGAAGDPVTGSYKQGADGKLSAVSVYFGGRGEAKGEGKGEAKGEAKGTEKKKTDAQ